ncbi:MAG TPA: helix-turn-helix transcriptional regulator [bacterium]|nr:helix-turn-helix transcriptional regulator [bacterium]
MKTLSERIKALRLPGETQAQFADRLGTTQASISRYLNGRHPDRATLIKIAKATSVTLDWLLTGQGPMAADKAAESSGDPELLMAALAYLGAVRSIPAKDRTSVQEMVRDVVENKEVRKNALSHWEAFKKGGK